MPCPQIWLRALPFPLTKLKYNQEVREEKCEGVENYKQKQNDCVPKPVTLPWECGLRAHLLSWMCVFSVLRALV